MPKKIDIERRKKEITEKALQVFIQEGYENAQLAKIALECRMGRTTIYQYFKNKHELYTTVMNQAWEKIDHEYQAIVKNPSASAFEKINRFTDLLLEESRQQRDLFIIMSDPAVSPKKESQEKAISIRYRHAQDLQKKFRRLLEEGMETGEIRQVNPSPMAFTLYSLASSFVLNHQLLRNWPLSEVRKSIDLLLESLKNPTPPAG